MTPTEFLQNRNIVAIDKTDLLIGFENGEQESLIELLESYHQTKLKLLGIGDVSDYKKLNIHECLNDIMGVTDRCFGTFGVPRGSLRYQFKKAIDKMICCR